MTVTLDEYTHLCSELVTFSQTDPAQSGYGSTIGNLEEIGEWCAKVLLDRPVAPGTEVSLTARKKSLYGKVRGWEYTPEIGYLVDVELNRNSKWSSARFQPQHLLRVRNKRGEPSVAAA